MMKRYVCRLLSALLLIFLSDRAIGTFLRLSYDNTRYGVIGRKNHILGNIDSEIIVMGSSRALHHYIPRIITDSTGRSCFNCGQGGQGIIYHYALLRAITRRYIPELVIYELTFEYDLARSDNTRFIAEVRNMHRACGDSIIYDIDPMEKIKMLSAIYPYNSQLFHIFGDQFQKKDLTLMNGYIPKYGQLAADAVYHGRQYGSLEIDKVKYSYLEKFLKEYHQLTRIIVITSPMYKTKRPEIYQAAERLCGKYGVKFINRSDDPRFIYKAEYYYDVSHFNDTGARAYTKSIVGEVRKVMSE